MKYLVHTQADAAPFWDALRDAPTKETLPYPVYTSFANFAEVVLYPYKVLQNWAKDQSYTVPNEICTTPVTHVLYFIPPKKNGDYRVFVGFVHDNSRKLLVVEITLLQLLIRFSKVTSVAGSEYDVGNYNVLPVYKGQHDPIYFPLKWDDNKYLHAREVADPNGNAYLEFEIGVPWLAEGVLNKQASSLAAVLGEP